jgi:hypothetical protein
MEKVNENHVQAYKVNNIGLGSPEAPHWHSKVQKATNIGTMSLKMGNVRLYFVITTEIEVFKTSNGLEKVNNN